MEVEKQIHSPSCDLHTPGIHKFLGLFLLMKTELREAWRGLAFWDDVVS